MRPPPAFTALFAIVVANPMRGTGRFNAAQGAIMTAQGGGAALSTTFAGVVVDATGYNAACLALAVVTTIGVLLCFTAMPETGA